MLALAGNIWSISRINGLFVIEQKPAISMAILDQTKQLFANPSHRLQVSVVLVDNSALHGNSIIRGYLKVYLFWLDELTLGIVDLICALNYFTVII